MDELKLEVGDLVAVRYPGSAIVGDLPERWLGFVIETTESSDPYSMDKMWCFKTESVHILNTDRDYIEVLNK